MLILNCIDSTTGATDTFVKFEIERTEAHLRYLRGLLKINEYKKDNKNNDQ